MRAVAAGIYVAMSCATYAQAVFMKSDVVFNPAVYEFGVPEPSIRVFPAKGAPFTITLPFAPGNIAFSQDGDAVYACGSSSSHRVGSPRGEGAHALAKITFKPVQSIEINTSERLAIVSISKPSSSSVVFISGNRNSTAGSSRQAGIFEINETNGRLRPLKLVEDPTATGTWPLSHWTDLSASPSGSFVATTRNRVLEIISLSDGSIRTIAGLAMGRWSPDGKWLAAVDLVKGRIVIMDAVTLAITKTLSGSDAVWSPDSKLLLGVEFGHGCSPYFGTLRTVELLSGKVTLVETSKCQVKQALLGWLRADITN